MNESDLPYLRRILSGVPYWGEKETEKIRKTDPYLMSPEELKDYEEYLDREIANVDESYSHLIIEIRNKKRVLEQQSKIPKGLKTRSIAKLTNRDVVVIRHLCKLGYKYQDIAVTYSVHTTAIGTINRRLTYRSVPEEDLNYRD